MINIINAAQENSPITVVQALDKVLEILRTSELYSPYFAQEIRDDDMTSDYLGGLVSVRNFPLLHVCCEKKMYCENCCYFFFSQ